MLSLSSGLTLQATLLDLSHHARGHRGAKFVQGGTP